MAEGGAPGLPRIGFVGIGRMGRPMAQRLVAAGYPTTVLDTDTEAARRVAGAAVAPSLAELAGAADVVLISVPGPREVDDVVCGAGGILDSARPGTLVIETSTIGVAQGRALAKACASRGLDMLDAPVSGGTAGAGAGTLVFTVGGEAAAFARATDVFAVLGQHAFHLGPSGSGYVAKAVNQAIYLSYAAVFCEALGLGRSHGLDTDQLLDALRLSVAGQPLSTGWEERIRNGERSAGFAVRRVRKDLAAASDAAALSGYPLPLIEAIAATYERAETHGRGGDDMSVLYDLAVAASGMAR